MIVAAAKKTIRRGLGLVAPAVWSLRPKPSLVILTYHRVLPKDHPDRRFEQPGMYVSPETLEMHLRVVKKHFEIVDLGDWVRRSKDGEPLPDRACAITFDDGWRDNYDYAFPILRRNQVPVTIFLVANFVGSNYEFWPNRLARLLATIREQPEAARAALERLLARLGMPSLPSDMQSSMEFQDAAIAAAKSVPDATMLQWLDAINAGVAPTLAGRSLLDEAEIREMSVSGVVRFGSHSLKHTRLIAGLAPEIVSEEVAGSQRVLRDLTGHAVELFCYPNGDYSSAALDVVRGSYGAAVTTATGWNRTTTDPHLMRRVSLHEDIASDEWCFLARVGAIA